MSTTALTTSRRAQEQVTWPARADQRARKLAWAALAICAVVAVGWFADVEVLKRLSGSALTMKLNTAVACGLLAAACLTSIQWLRQACVLIVLVFGALLLLQYSAGVDLHIDQLLVQDSSSSAAGYPGRPTAATGVCLILLGAARVFNELHRSVLAQLLATVPTALSALAVFGYLYGVSPLYVAGSFSTMNPATAVTLLLLSLATLLVTPGGMLQWISFGTDPGAVLQRFLIPVAVVVLPAGGWLVVEGRRSELYTPEFGSALLMVFSTCVVVALAMVTGRIALRIDDERETLLDKLGAANQQLEDRVRVRSHQLNRQRTKLVLLEERDRIARDLHDRVTQRIFAAGLQLTSLGRTQRKSADKTGRPEVVADRLDGIAIELDLVIRELRNSIFELTSIDDHEDIEQIVRDIISRASRILGYMPRVEVRGQVAGLRSDLVAQVASVVQEGLSNIARHAHASAAEVTLTATGEHIEVCVRDNGDGMPEPLPRSSGVSNLISRARDLGGTATWSANAPYGTTLTWRVPREVDGSTEGYVKRTPVAFSDSDHRRVASAGS